MVADHERMPSPICNRPATWGRIALTRTGRPIEFRRARHGEHDDAEAEGVRGGREHRRSQGAEPEPGLMPLGMTNGPAPRLSAGEDAGLLRAAVRLLCLGGVGPGQVMRMPGCFAPLFGWAVGNRRHVGGACDGDGCGGGCAMCGIGVYGTAASPPPRFLYQAASQDGRRCSQSP